VEDICHSASTWKGAFIRTQSLMAHFRAVHLLARLGIAKTGVQPGMMTAKTGVQPWHETKLQD
jgi:hypothetical protein